MWEIDEMYPRLSVVFIELLNTVIVSEVIEWTGLGQAEFVCAH